MNAGRRFGWGLIIAVCLLLTGMTGVWAAGNGLGTNGAGGDRAWQEMRQKQIEADSRQSEDADISESLVTEPQTEEIKTQEINGQSDDEAKIGDSGTPKSLAAALGEAKSGDTIIVLKDCEMPFHKFWRITNLTIRSDKEASTPYVIKRQSALAQWVLSDASSVTLENITLDGNTEVQANQALFDVYLNSTLKLNDKATLQNAYQTRGISTSSGEEIQGVGIVNRGNLIMAAGSAIKNCKAAPEKKSFGGGVLNYGTFNMNGGSITDCEVQNSGGGCYNDDESTFTMCGGSIKDCISKYGGGCYNEGGATVTMSEGSIENCQSTYGGGIYNGKASTGSTVHAVILSGKIAIQNCEAVYGGGIYDNSGNLTIEGGSITGNAVFPETEGYYSYGGGIYASKNITLKNMGPLKIKGNVAKASETDETSTDSNIVLYKNCQIVLANNDVDASSPIGVDSLACYGNDTASASVPVIQSGTDPKDELSEAVKDKFASEHDHFSIAYQTAEGAENKTQLVLAEDEITSIVIKPLPTKTSYQAGEYFEPTGGVITRTYADGTIAVSDSSNYWEGVNYFIEGQRQVFQYGDRAVYLTYRGKEFPNNTIPVTVANPTPAITYYTITPKAGTGGTIDPAAARSVAEGGSLTVTIKPDEGYAIADVLVDGTSVKAALKDNTYTFTGVTASHTIEATFEKAKFTITATAGDGGTIDPSGAVAVEKGASQSFTITPAAGYRLEDVAVDGFSIGVPASYTFEAVAADHTIAATFAKTAAPSLQYLIHGQNYGWSQGWKSVTDATAMAGTTGQALRGEALKLKDDNAGIDFHYQAHVQNAGWMDPVAEGQQAGTTGQGLRMEAVRIWATGNEAASVRYQYRVHIQNLGWSDWIDVGTAQETAVTGGTTGRSLRLEAIQFRVN